MIETIRRDLFSSTPPNGPFFIVGNAFSGKSELIHSLLESQNSVVVFGTSSLEEPSLLSRVEELKSLRPKEWRSIDEIQNLSAAILKEVQKEQWTVVDSMSQWIAHELLRIAPGLQHQELEKRSIEMVERFCAEVVDSQRLSKRLILISNETSGAESPADPIARIYRKTVSVMNRKLAQKCQSVITVQVGLAKVLKS